MIVFILTLDLIYKFYNALINHTAYFLGGFVGEMAFNHVSFLVCKRRKVRLYSDKINTDDVD